MDLWGYRIATTTDWIILGLVLVLILVLYFGLVIFIRKYTTGMLGGFLLAILGMALVFGPAYYLILHENNTAQYVLSGVAILAGCITLAVAAYKLTNFWDF